jgi:hypothetical protein
MRAIDKGTSITTYSNYKDALEDLTNKLGHYCSYCEMGVNNMIEVEHVHPVANGGNELDWDNFLLSCRYCNGIKSNHNGNRTGYFWPDRDNTDLAFDYTLTSPITIPKANLSAINNVQAQSLIDLIGLDRYPGSPNRPTKKDKRWRLRDEAITTARNSYNNWCIIKDDTQTPYRLLLAKQIAQTSVIGFYSIWCKIFENEPLVLNEIEMLWKSRYSNYKEYQQGTTTRIVRPNGQI